MHVLGSRGKCTQFCRIAVDAKAQDTYSREASQVVVKSKLKTPGITLVCNAALKEDECVVSQLLFHSRVLQSCGQAVHDKAREGCMANGKIRREANPRTRPVQSSMPS